MASRSLKYGSDYLIATSGCGADQYPSPFRPGETMCQPLQHRYGMDIRLVHEETLLGSGGTLLANRSFVEGEKDFIIAYADNLTDIHLGRMVESHRLLRGKGAC